MIIFENDGQLDIMAIKTMGVSVKESGAIGYFGTGLKFAIAVLLRNNHKVTICIDEMTYEFTTEPVQIRGKWFNIIHMNDEALAFTDELGKNWEVWMAFRELASNAMDERGKFYYAAMPPPPEAGRTIIIVEGDKMDEAYSNKDEVFFNTKNARTTPTADVMNRQSQSIYYKGVVVSETSKPCMMTYNLKSGITLTEDRTANSSYDIKRGIARFILTDATEDEVWTFLKAPQDSFESDIEVDIYVDPSDNFLNVSKRIIENKERLKKSAFDVYKKATGYIEKDEPMELNGVQKKQLERAMTFCCHLEPDIKNMTIVVQEKLKGDALGMAHHPTEKIYLSKRVFEQGTKQVTTTLLEEFYHIRYKYNDNTYAFQNFLFDQILTLLEQVKGEPI